MKDTPRKRIHIWATDNNGQIASECANDAAIMGKHTWANKTGEINGRNMGEILRKFKMFSANTEFMPKNNDKRNMTTWRSPDGNNWREVDYIAIIERRKIGLTT